MKDFCSSDTEKDTKATTIWGSLHELHLYLCLQGHKYLMVWFLDWKFLHVFSKWNPKNEIVWLNTGKNVLEFIYQVNSKPTGLLKMHHYTILPLQQESRIVPFEKWVVSAVHCSAQLPPGWGPRPGCNQFVVRTDISEDNGLAANYLICAKVI